MCRTVRPSLAKENHAHDVYDAFHAIHKTAIKKSTFFLLDEMRNIIRASHAASLRFEKVENSGNSENSENEKKRWRAAAGDWGSRVF